MRSLNIGSWIWDALLCQLHYLIAGAQLRVGLTTDAVNSASRSIDTGFADAGWLAADPEWRSLRERGDFRQLIERVQLIPSVTIDLSRVPLPDAASSSAGTVQPS